MKWMILACGLILLKYSNHVTARHWPAVCSRCTAVYADHNYFLCLAAGEDICVQLQRPTRLHSTGHMGGREQSCGAGGAASGGGGGDGGLFLCLYISSDHL